MIIEVKDKLHKILSIFESGINRWTRFISKRPEEAESGLKKIQELRDEQIRHKRWKEKIRNEQERMICDYLSSTANKIRSDPDMQDKIKIDLELRPNFMPGGGMCCSYNIEETNVVRTRKNVPVVKNADQQLSEDLAMRQKQRDEKPKDTLPEDPGLMSKISEECSSIQQIHKRLNQL